MTSPLNPGLPTSFAQRDAESRNPLVGKAQTPENGTGLTLHSLPGLGVHLEPQETQLYDVIHAPNTDSAEAQQAYQPHRNVGSVPAGRQGSCHRAQADMDQQATALCRKASLRKCCQPREYGKCPSWTRGQPCLPAVWADERPCL